MIDNGDDERSKEHVDETKTASCSCSKTENVNVFGRQPRHVGVEHLLMPATD